MRNQDLTGYWLNTQTHLEQGGCDAYCQYQFPHCQYQFPHCRNLHNYNTQMNTYTGTPANSLVVLTYC